MDTGSVLKGDCTDDQDVVCDAVLSAGCTLGLVRFEVVVNGLVIVRLGIVATFERSRHARQTHRGFSVSDSDDLRAFTMTVHIVCRRSATLSMMVAMDCLVPIGKTSGEVNQTWRNHDNVNQDVCHQRVMRTSFRVQLSSFHFLFIFFLPLSLPLSAYNLIPLRPYSMPALLILPTSLSLHSSAKAKHQACSVERTPRGMSASEQK